MLIDKGAPVAAREDDMAIESDSGELPAHERSYSRFIWMMKWGAIVSLVTALVVVLLISN
jgi:hypothetical protein